MFRHRATPLTLIEPMLARLQPGRLTYSEGLLVLAAYGDQKSYPIQATVLMPEQFAEYLLTLKTSASRPLLERFVIADEHWISGEIKIDETGRASIFFCDSIGFSYTETENEFLLRQFTDIFPEPEHCICISEKNTVQQRSPVGCSVFALHNVLRMIRFSRWNDGSFLQDGESHDLFRYLMNPAHHTRKSIQMRISRDPEVPKRAIELLVCQMPLALLRTAQLKPQVFQAVIAARHESERNSPVNKSGLRLESCDDFRMDPVSGTQRNGRLGAKLTKLQAICDDFFEEQSREKRLPKLEAYTLEGLKKRLVAVSPDVHQAPVAANDEFAADRDTVVRCVA